jgi:hypothetical protein
MKSIKQLRKVLKFVLGKQDKVVLDNNAYGRINIIINLHLNPRLASVCLSVSKLFY